MLRASIALLTLALVSGTGAGAVAAATTSDLEEAERPAASEGESPAAASPAVTAKKKRSSSKSSRSRRSRRPKVSGRVVPDVALRQTPLPRPSGKLRIFSVASNEEIDVNVYNEDGSYNVEALKQVGHILRCKRTNAEREMEPRLVTILSHVSDNFAGRRVEVVSAFRNQRRTTSYHYQGSAIDIRVPGVTPTKLRAFVESLDEGGMGIGLYPKTKFVHIDVRPPPSYRWIDYSSADPDSQDKRPPRGFKKRKPVS